MHTWVVIEYLSPISPANRRVWDSGAGPLIFDDSVDGAMRFFASIGGAPSVFRVITVAAARGAGLLP